MTLEYGTQKYGWWQIYQAAGKDYATHLEEVLAQIAEAGLTCYETELTTDADAERLAPLLEKHGLQLRSMYALGKLHVPDWPEQVAAVLEQAERGRHLGAKIVVINPDPLRWGQPQDKDDTQLRTQVAALTALGQELKSRGMTLAYHTHDMEMRQAAREFHHTLLHVPEEAMGLCLDAHWIYRGAGNSQCALDDIIQLYGSRIVYLHLRQSQGGIWTKYLQEGDIDYRPLFQRLSRQNFNGPAILELAREAGTPQTITPAEAHRRSRTWIETISQES